MLIALLIAGIGFLLAGLLGIAIGLPEKEFSIGNTEILAGVITACTGMILLGLWLAVRELKEIAVRLGLGPGAAAIPRTEFSLPDASPAPHDQAVENDGALFNQPNAIHPADAESATPPSAPSTPPWHEETAARDRVRSDMPPGLPPPAPEAAAKPKRNLLFSSTSRRERERAEGRTATPSTAEAAPPPSRPSEPPPATFEEAWPQPERARTSDAPARRNVRTTFAEEGNASAAGAPPAVQNDEPPPVTVLKSGVVDGMAYSLYSDGSIEAQMPEGMMRFASIDDLRAHLDQRG